MNGADTIIRTKNGNVDSIEVESVIGEIDGVAQVAVIGIPHAKLGEAVHAIVVPYLGKKVTAEEVVARCHVRIADFKCPRSVTIRSEPLPQSSAGQISRSELRSHYWRAS